MQLRQTVDATQIKQNIEVNLKRLVRQYQYSVLHYDEASLLDLSHVLRVWLDMQASVEAYLAEHGIPYRFKKYTLGPSLLKRCHGSKCVIAYFVDGVTTYSGRQHVFRLYLAGNRATQHVHELQTFGR